MTSLMMVKLRRDVRANATRFALMVVAIAVSLSVCGAVLYAWSAVGRETRTAYAESEPASATLLLDKQLSTRWMADVTAATEARPGVLAATGRTQFDSQVEVNGESREIPVQVFVADPDDPLRMARIDVEGAVWPPSDREILIGRDSLDLLGVSVGDEVTLRGGDGTPIRLRVAGTAYDPSLAPSGQEQRGHAYLAADALLGAADQPLLDQLKIQVSAPEATSPSTDRERIVDVAADTAEWLTTTYGIVVEEIQVPEPGAHPHQFQADVLLLSLLGGGLAALLLSTVLVATMLNNLFTQQTRQIGIMKAIGARSGRIGLMYLAMILLVAGAATALAAGPAGWLGRSLAAQILSMLGIEPVSLAPASWTYLAVAGVGVLLPPLMTLGPLLRASRITVRSAIDHHGGTARPSRAADALARLSRGVPASRTLLLALRNMVRRPARFALSVGLLAGAGIVFVAGMSLGDGMAAVAEEQKAARVWDVEIQLAEPADPAAASAALEGIDKVTDVEGLTVASAGLAGTGAVPVTRTYPDQGHGRVSVMALPATSSLFTRPEVIEGRWLRPDAVRELVLSASARDDNVPDNGVGGRVQLSIDGRMTTWRVAGLVDDGSGAIYTTAAGLAAALDQPEQVNLLRVATRSHTEETRRAVAEEAENALGAAGIPVKSAASVSRANESSEGHMGPLVTILLSIAIAMGVVGGIGLASTMSANVLDRTREFGVMHAIGARPRAVRRIVAVEGLLLGLVSCVVALLPALGLIAVLGNGLGNLMMDVPLPYRVSLLAVGIWVVLATVGAAMATDAAATRASRITVREALAYL